MPPPQGHSGTLPRLRHILAAAAVGAMAALLLLRWAAPTGGPVVTDQTPELTPAPLPSRPQAAPIEALPREVSEALDLMAQGRLREAQRLMLGFHEGPAADALPTEHRDTIAAAIQRLEASPVLAAAIELERGFEAADLNRLRLTLGSLTRDQMIALRRDPLAARQVDDARRLTAEVDAIQARLDRDRLEALRLAQDFKRRHPRFAIGLDFERRAAAEIEETAGRLIAVNRLEEARALLLELRALTGDGAAGGAGIEAKLAAIDVVFQQRDDLNATVREIEMLGWRRPHEALELLARMDRTPENRDRFAQLESTLTMLMEDLDQKGPAVEVLAPDGSPVDGLVYQPDEDVVLLVRAHDDYEVTSVVLAWQWYGDDGAGDIVEATLRPVTSSSPPPTNGGAEMEPAGVELEATITAAEHQGRNLQFWAEATDRGGRRARSDDSQLVPERRGFLRRLGLRRGR